MKSVLSNNCCENKEKPFPKLMISEKSGAVYFMSKDRAGVCVHETDNDFCDVIIGEYNDHLYSGGFKDYEGDVCLTND